YHDDRQTPRLPLLVEGRLHRGRQDPRPRREPDRRRRMEPRPVRTRAHPGHVPYRQRLLRAEHPRGRSHRQMQQDLANSLPRLRRTLYAQGQDPPSYQPVRHPERTGACCDLISFGSNRESSGGRIDALTAGSDYVKRGLAITPVKFGISFNISAFNQGGALVVLYKDGSVLVTHGGTEMGQGLHQKMLQVAATTLGVPLSTVRLAPTRTDKVPNTSATAASSGSDLNGGAVKNACDQILERLKQVAAGILGAPAHEVVISRGIVTALSSSKSVSWEELINTAYFQRIQLSA